jgi:hypothetical protein
MPLYGEVVRSTAITHVYADASLALCSAVGQSGVVDGTIMLRTGTTASRRRLLLNMRAERHRHKAQVASQPRVPC